MPQRPSQARVQDRRGWHQEPSLSYGEEDDWLLVHQVTDPKRPSLTLFFPKKGEMVQGKDSEQLVGF
jgi:hypothetical protein